MKYYILIFVCFGISSAFGDTPDGMITKAEALYKAGVYDEALQKYRAISESGLQSAGLYANLAACHFQMKSYPVAILYYEKALKLSPGNKKLLSDIRLVRSQIPELVPEPEPFVLITFWKKWSGIFSERIWAVLNILSLGTIVALFGFKRLSGFQFSKKSIFIGLIVSGFFFAGTLLAGITASTTAYGNTAYIIMEENTVLHKGPDDISPELMDLPTGTRVTRSDSIGHWMKVSAGYGDEGWIPSDKAVQI
jgi:tetratricopeptide (TPR) repeat protein